MKTLGKVFFVLILLCASAAAQTTAFTYQGSLKDGASPANGNYDFEFKMFDMLSGGVQQGSTVQKLNVAVANGIYSVTLDFGGVFTGADRFLDISVRTTGGPSFTPLSPRQAVASSPYAIRSLNAATADTVVVSGVPPGNDNYIQNGTSPQASSNFNIDGAGSADIFNVASEYRLRNGAIMRSPTDDNLFVGFLTGTSNTGTNNSFFGTRAGEANTTGSFNSFFGLSAGRSNTTGQFNAMFGYRAGQLNTIGIRNSFFGSNAGGNNTDGSYNSFFGGTAGALNTTGSENSFFGERAGQQNTTGASNSFFGKSSGESNSTGFDNSFFGWSAGYSNTTGFDNAFFGSRTGYQNMTGYSNSFFGRRTGEMNTNGSRNSFLGYVAGFNNTDGSFNSFVGSEAGFSNTIGNYNSFFGERAGYENIGGSNNSFFGSRAGYSNNDGVSNSFFGTGAGRSNLNGNGNSFFGQDAGQLNTGGGFNAFFGREAGINNTTGSYNVFIGFTSGFSNTTGTRNTLIGYGTNISPNLTYATAIGAGAEIAISNRIQLGRVNFDTVSIGALASGSSTQLCINGTVLSSCSSSRRYKENILPFDNGLSIIKKLQPVTFDWKARKAHDLGLIAEDVGDIEPLLNTYNEKGQIEGIKYDQLTVVLINAIKEQQSQIENQKSVVVGQQSQIDALKRQVDAFKALLCSQNPSAAACKPVK